MLSSCKFMYSLVIKAYITSKTWGHLTLRSIKPIMPINTLKTVYYSHFNAIITYGLPFWGNSPHSTKIFKMQKRIVIIMMGYRNRVSCRSLFKRLEILPFMSQYILSLMLFVKTNIFLY